MTDKELLEKAEKLGIDPCRYCVYDSECAHGVTNGGGEPHFPPCADKSMDKLVNIDALAEIIEESEGE